MNNIFNTNLENILNEYTPSSLAELDSLRLINRYDTKMISSKQMIPSVLSVFRDEHKILEIDNKRHFKYSSCYYDTDDYLFYLWHHNGQRNRLKIRNRKYLNDGKCFLEIKQKTGNSRTIKNRLGVDWHNSNEIIESGDFIKSQVDFNPQILSKKISVEYNRITLINSKLQEKITIDTDIKFTTNDKSLIMNNVALIELKHKDLFGGRESIDKIKSLGIKTVNGFSKYCMGLVLTSQVIKYNRFKTQLLQINKITGN